MKCLNLRFDDEIHEKVRLKCFNNKVSLQKYIMDLIKKDLEKDICKQK